MKWLAVVLVACLFGCSHKDSPLDPHKISEKHPHVKLAWPNGRVQEVCASSWEFCKSSVAVNYRYGTDYGCRMIYPQYGGAIIFREGEFGWWWENPHK